MGKLAGKIVVLASVCVMHSADAETVRKVDDDNPADVAARWINSSAISLRVNSDPVFRTIVCRVPFTNYTFESLIRATGLPKQRLATALGELVVMGLVSMQTESSGNVLVVPASENARKMMREWADKWCMDNNACGVQR